MSSEHPGDSSGEPLAAGSGNEFAVPAAGWQRLVGRYTGERPGPKLICVGGLHGNEPAGVIAMQRVLNALEHRKVPFCGELVGFAGNLQALNQGARYLERDMNRMWTPQLVERALQPPQLAREGVAVGPGSGHDAEWRELAELHTALAAEIDNYPNELFLLDLHTSSADGVPFGCVGDTLRNRRFARPFPMPVLLGLEEQLEGALLEYLNNHGVVTFGFEGGQHQEAHSIDRHEAGIWIGLMSAGCFPGPVPEQVEQGRALLRSVRGGLPKVLEILHRHALRPNDGFTMHPGYENFTPVSAGEILAEDKTGKIRSSHDGRIMLPLYQGKGDDGYFIARRVRRFWLRVSALLRVARCDGLLKWLPGIRRAKDNEQQLLINKRVARLFPLQIFHLFGYRKLSETENSLVVTRRPFDLEGPERAKLGEKSAE